MGLRRWGTALPVLWSGEMRLFCGAACGRLKERKLGLSPVGRNCRCWRSGGRLKMRLFCGAACGRLKERKLGLSCLAKGEGELEMKGKMAGFGQGKGSRLWLALACFGREDQRKREVRWPGETKIKMTRGGGAAPLVFSGFGREKGE